MRRVVLRLPTCALYLVTSRKSLPDLDLLTALTIVNTVCLAFIVVFTARLITVVNSYGQALLP
jgi:hypothetical protein